MASPETCFLPRLPQELVDHIIDHLNDDLVSLRKCALVCQAWLPASRYHLFAKVSLKATSPQQEPSLLQERCKRLHGVLVRSPEIICNIREVEICEGSPLHHPYPDAQCSTTWVTTERTLMAFFRMLTHVRRFDFSATSSLYWMLLPPTFQAALYTLLSLPTLTYIRLHSWMFPNFDALNFLLSHCQNLKGLALSSTTVCTDGSPPDDQEKDKDETFSSERTYLEVLTLDFLSFTYLDYWLLGRNALINVQALRELRVAHFHDAIIVDKLLSAIGSSLEHFHLKPGSWNGIFNPQHNHWISYKRWSLSVHIRSVSQLQSTLHKADPWQPGHRHVVGNHPPCVDHGEQ